MRKSTLNLWSFFTQTSPAQTRKRKRSGEEGYPVNVRMLFGKRGNDGQQPAENNLMISKRDIRQQAIERSDKHKRGYDQPAEDKCKARERHCFPARASRFARSC